MAVPNFSKTCRTCMGKKGEMRPLFGSCLDTMLMTVADVQVHTGDGLPETLCVQCVLQVSRAFNFKQVCQRSDANLRQVYLDSLATSSLPIETPSECEATTKQQIPSNEADRMPNQGMMNYPDVNGTNSKCLFVVRNMSLLNRSSDQMLMGMSASDEILDVESDIEENHQTRQDEDIGISDSNPTDINNLVSTLHIQANGENDFESFTSDDTDADNLLVTVASSLFVLQDHSNIGTTMQYFCVECGLNFSQLEELTSHQTTHRVEKNNKPFRVKKDKHLECDICKKKFGFVKILRRHMKIHCAVKPHVCNICDRAFVESSNLTKHKKKHTGELRNTVGKPNLCSVCGKGFKWASSLSKHMKHHTRRKLLQCPYCPKYYVEARSLEIHVRHHTGEKPFICDVCNKGFTQLGNLEKHKRVHTGEKPFNCPICGKGFSQSGYVSVHLRTHTGEKPYRCKECGKTFAGSNTLTIHQRTHTGERPYACSMCDKKFARQESAVIHERSHTGEKPHICSTCNRGFTSSSHLKSHMRTHSGLKLHECTVCSKRFAGGSSLKVHMKSHTIPESPNYACTLCDEKFVDLMHLEEHEFQHELVSDSSLLQTNIHDGVISMVDDSMILGHDLIDPDQHNNA